MVLTSFSEQGVFITSMDEAVTALCFPTGAPSGISVRGEMVHSVGVALEAETTVSEALELRGGGSVGVVAGQTSLRKPPSDGRVLEKERPSFIGVAIHTKAIHLCF